MTHFTVASLLNRLANRVALVAILGFVNVLRARHRDCFTNRVVDGFVERALLLVPNDFAYGLVTSCAA